MAFIPRAVTEAPIAVNPKRSLRLKLEKVLPTDESTGSIDDKSDQQLLNGVKRRMNNLILLSLLVGVFIGSSFPGTVGMSKIYVYSCLSSYLFMSTKLRSVI